MKCGSHKSKVSYKQTPRVKPIKKQGGPYPVKAKKVIVQERKGMKETKGRR